MIYNNYTDRLKSIVSESRTRKSNIEKGFNSFRGIGGIPNENFKRKMLFQEQRNFSNMIHLNTKSLGIILDYENLKNAKLGLHPDFIKLKGTDEVEYHYIISIFIDIQGSTNLHKTYGLDEIYQITNTIQSAAIHTCITFGGHIQRLQGDGILAYFGGKTIEKNKAVEMAITACSMFSYFVKNDLKDIFLEDGIENISTRIGIDFGDDNDVQWANFGLMDVSELTTNSLHTSLASKMQTNASKNGIVVGQNIKERIKTDIDLFDFVRKSDGTIEKSIFEIPQKGFFYSQYSFNWFQYLKTLPFVACTADEKLYILDETDRLRLESFREKKKLLITGNAYSNNDGTITSEVTGVKHKEHRFHYEK